MELRSASERRKEIIIFFLKMSRARAWCFTDNTCDEAFWASLDCKYLVYGREVAPSTGHRHLQGYVVFTAAKTAATVRKMNCKVHWEIAAGNAA